MGKRVMALLKDNTDKSFFFAFGAGRAFTCCSVNFYTSVSTSSKEASVMPVSSKEASVRRQLSKYKGLG